MTSAPDQLPNDVAALQAIIADLLHRLPDHKINQLDDLAPWNWKPGPVEEANAA